MSLQQINLLNPQLLTPRVAFSARTIALTLLAVVAVGVVLDVVVESTAAGITRQLEQAQAIHDHLQSRLDTLAQAPEQTQASEDKQAQEIAEQKKHLARLKALQQTLAGAPGKTAFSSRLQAFAHEGVSGIWLTGFELGEQGFHLQGRALQTASIPDYLAVLARQPALRDLPLSGFSIVPPEDEGESKAKAPGVAFAINPVSESK